MGKEKRRRELCLFLILQNRDLKGTENELLVFIYEYSGVDAKGIEGELLIFNSGKQRPKGNGKLIVSIYL